MSTYRSLIPDACYVLERQGGAMSIGVLARALEVSVRKLRVQIDAYEDLDPSMHEPGFDTFLYIVHADEADDPADSDLDVVRLGGSVEDFIGIERFDARVLGPLYTAAEDLLAQEPDNAALASAATKLREEFLPEVQPRRVYRKETVAAIAEAIRGNRRMRIVYSRAWKPGVSGRVIEPYRLVNTRRGYEVDAGPLDDEQSLRTFLVSRIREYEVLDQTFVPPEDAIELSRRTRQTEPVTGVVPHTSRWAINKYAESVQWHDDQRIGDKHVRFTAQVLPPVNERVALMALSVGSGMLLDSAEYDTARTELTRRLWDHHRLGEP